MRSRFVCLLALFASLALRAERAVSLGDYARESRQKIEARVRTALADAGATGEVTGVVSGTCDDGFFMQNADDGLKVVYGGALPKVGAQVTVVGKPMLEGGRVVLAASQCKVVGHAVRPQPRIAGAKELTYAGSDAKRDVNWLVVELSGRAIGATERGFALDIDGVPVNVLVERKPSFLSHCEVLRPLVKVRGVAEVLLDQSDFFASSRYVVGVRVNVNEPTDIELMPDMTYLLNRRDRRVMWAIGFLVAVLIVALGFAAFAIFRQRRRHFRTETLMHERKRMADDLHDTIEQHLVGAGMLIRLSRHKEAQDVLVRAKREIRDIVWGLKNDDMMRQSPADMIRQLAHDETTKGICRVDVQLQGLPQQMDARAMRDLSLIVREAIGNAVKHGGAKKIAISADPLPTGWLLRVANDGAPFDPTRVPGPAEGHFGLEGMRERARRLRATVSFSVKGSWTILSLEGKK